MSGLTTVSQLSPAATNIISSITNDAKDRETLEKCTLLSFTIFTSKNFDFTKRPSAEQQDLLNRSLKLIELNQNSPFYLQFKQTHPSKSPREIAEEMLQEILRAQITEELMKQNQLEMSLSHSARLNLTDDQLMDQIVLGFSDPDQLNKLCTLFDSLNVNPFPISRNQLKKALSNVMKDVIEKTKKSGNANEENPHRKDFLQAYRTSPMNILPCIEKLIAPKKFPDDYL